MTPLNCRAQDKIKEENASKGGVIRPTPQAKSSDYDEML
jgi:hypothetical protein